MNTTTTISPTRTFRLSVVRTLAIGLLAGGGALLVAGPLAGTASAGPILPTFPTLTIPPQTTTTTTVKPKLPPYMTIPPYIVLDPGTPPTTATPTTVAPTTVAPTSVAPTTVAPKAPTTKKPKGATTSAGDNTTGGSPTDPGATDPVADVGADAAVADPAPAGQPTDAQVLSASGSDPITLGKGDSTPIVPIVGGSLLVAAALVAGGLAFDKRRKA